MKFVIKKVNKYDIFFDIFEIMKFLEYKNIIKLVVMCWLEEVVYLIYENVEGK